MRELNSDESLSKRLDELRGRYKQRLVSLDALSRLLEEIVISQEDNNQANAEELRGIWSEIEIINALSLESGNSPNESEVAELLDEFSAVLGQLVQT